MTQSRTPFWTVEQRAVLDAILDQLIPASTDGRLPAAGDLGIADFIAADVGLDAGLTATFERGLALAATLGPATPDSVKHLEAQAPTFFTALLRLAYMGYYSRPDIRGLLGLSEKPVHPDGYAVPVESADLMAELTAPVRARGQCYRNTQTGSP